MKNELREQAESAAMKWYEEHPEGMPRDLETAIAMYLAGYAAAQKNAAEWAEKEPRWRDAGNG